MLEFMHKGGPIMWVIFLCSIFAMAVVIEKILQLRRVSIDTDSFMNGISDLLRRNRIIDAINMCNKTPGPIAQILKAGIMKHDRSKPEIREAIEDAALGEVPLLEKNLSVLATIAHITPLLGLLGTVMGMLRCFQTIEQKSTALQPVNPKDLAGGIWEALLTTVFGLCVAIPAYVAYNYLVNKVNGFILEMEKSSTDLVNLLLSRREQ
ncbi:MAG: MotA/TolQ/ExbB proton channel family protein [Candidatus Omnitrophica bacterium]|nr:MotA/TolQ/ExbB proton channel family protein [Candidatus Omnitrophota bacterium]